MNDMEGYFPTTPISYSFPKITGHFVLLSITGERQHAISEMFMFYLDNSMLGIL